MDIRTTYYLLLDAIMAIPKEQVKVPNMPVSTYTQEAMNMHYWAKIDRADLQRAGLDLTLVDALPARVDALKQAQSEWRLQRHDLDAAEQEWEQLIPHASQLHKDLLHYFRFAYREQPDRMKVVNRIAKGRSHANLVQDLCELAVLGRAQPDSLKLIGMEIEKLEQADELSARLGRLLAAVNAARATLNEAKDRRDRAYTYLKLAVDEVRVYGRFVFWKQKEKQLHYGSKYFRSIRAGLRRKALKEH